MVAVGGFVDLLKSLGATRLSAMAAVAVTPVGVFAFLILRATAPQMTPLFTDLTVEDSAGIIVSPIWSACRMWSCG